MNRRFLQTPGTGRPHCRAPRKQVAVVVDRSRSGDESPHSKCLRRTNRPGARRGFTLVELLITVTIIGILAGITLSALSAARQTARAAKTKSTIAKLDQIVMARYESYRTRRVPINTSGIRPDAAARLRLRALRELMRMEMPEREQDIAYPCASFPPNATDENQQVSFSDGSVTLQMRRSGLARAFFRHYVASPPSTEYQSAEFLYLMVSLGDPEARSGFSETEIGDADEDGWREFHDGWGNPIEFLRWAPAFILSDIQQRVPVGNPMAMQAAARERHDPFDTRNVDDDAYALLPLIYSAGPDGIYDINREPNWRFEGDPYFHVSPPSAGQPNNSGQPLDSANISVTAAGPANGSIDVYDNIHNHRIEQR